ncbi:MAG: hypothetical protein NTZ05_18400 [Chloroflexi bacterium]|nr:hypothetical protein [Chloroflexota bacterium]
MAEGNITERQVATWLRNGPLMLEELEEQAARWDEMPDWEQADWSLEWDQFVSYLRHVLDPAYHTGLMDAEQRSLYCDLVRGLKDALPLLQQLHLTLPPVSFDIAA